VFEMVKNVGEEKIKHVLTDPKLSAIKAMLEKDHAIDCLLLLHTGRGKWKDAKDFMHKNKLTLSDGTFRARMIEIESLGLAKSERIDPLKKYYVKTEFGEKIAKLLLGLFDEIST
jgi:hypothetical protein